MFIYYVYGSEFFSLLAELENTSLAIGWSFGLLKATHNLFKVILGDTTIKLSKGIGASFGNWRSVRL